jgi:hypothetical protein
MNETLYVTFITEENIAKLKKEYEKSILVAKVGTPVEFEVGKIILTQRIITTDLFDKTFHLSHENNWIVTRSEFDAMFNLYEMENSELGWTATRK